MTKNEKPQAGSELNDQLDPDALNDAAWAFVGAWKKHTRQDMTGQTWNNIKPMVAEAIQEYLRKAV